MAFLDKIGLERLWTHIVLKLGGKVDKVDGKGLSTCDFTAAEKEKLAGIPEGGGDVTVDSELSATSTNPVQNKVVNAAINDLSTLVGDTSVSTQINEAIVNKVDKVDGKGLSTNDYTTEEQTKLSGIEIGATKTVIDSALNSESTNPVQNKVVNDAISNLNTLVGDASVATQISEAIANKADSDHTHTASEVGADASGSAASALTSANSYTDTQISGVTETLGTKANTSDLTSHTSNTSNPHGVTKAQIGLGNVENKSSATIRGELSADDVTNALGYTPLETSTTYGVATQLTDGLMSAEDKVTLDKLDGYVGDSSVSSQISTAIANKADSSHTHSDYVNQNAFSNVKVGSTTIAADSTTDTLTLVAGSNITLTPNTSSDQITIAAAASSYTHPTYTAKSSGLYKVTVDSTGHVSAATAVSKSDITGLGIPSSNTNYYPTGWTWSDGTSSGPTASLTGSGMSAVSVGAIPSASDSVSGIVTTGAQTFGGTKTFADTVYVGGSSNWYPSVIFNNAYNSNYFGKFEYTYTGLISLLAYTSSSNRKGFQINPAGNILSNAVSINDVVNGTETNYGVYHTGNIVASTSEPSSPVAGMIWLELSE